MRTTYAPAVQPDNLPTSSAEWRRRSGLTDPVVVAAYVSWRLTAHMFRADPTYADFFTSSIDTHRG